VPVGNPTANRSLAGMRNEWQTAEGMHQPGRFDDVHERLFFKQRLLRFRRDLAPFCIQAKSPSLAHPGAFGYRLGYRPRAS
jgi:hypothetical protein